MQKLESQINGKSHGAPKNHPRGWKSDNLTLRCGLGHEPAFAGMFGLSIMPGHGKSNLENPRQTASLRRGQWVHMLMISFHRRAAIYLALTGCFLTGCNVGPKYHSPPVNPPAAYKELTPDDYKNTDGWKVAQPKDDALRGKWWEIFGDPQLNALEEKVNVSNQNIAAAAASFFAARALVKEARSQLFPTVTTTPAITVQRPSATVSSGKAGGSTSSSTGTFTDSTFPFDATWQPDLFGRIRNTIKSAAYAAQASAADLENTRLTVQADLAIDYFELRGQDALKQLLDSTVVAYQQSLDFTKAQYETGIGADEAVAEAETQLEATQAQDVALGIQRAQFEHAIAMLDRPAGVNVFPSRRTAHFKPSRHSHRRSLPASGAASRHRRSRAPDGPGQRPDRYCACRILSDGYVERRGRTRKQCRSRVGSHGRAAFSRWARLPRKPFLMRGYAGPRWSNSEPSTTRP